MKIIEALKKIKELQKKVEDLAGKVGDHSAISSLQTVVYQDQGKQVKEWIQAQSDILKEILRLRIAIQRVNLKTKVDIELGDKKVTKTIAEWIHRRRDLANKECGIWKKLTDRDIAEGPRTDSNGDKVEVTIQRFYKPEERDRMIDLFQNEPMIIDSKLEVINAITDI